MKILDCTLRDGGYHTNWDFDRSLVDIYIQSFSQLPVDYLEIGYRSLPKKEYSGEYFYLPIYIMEQIRSQTNKKLVVMISEKDTKPHDIKDLLNPCIGLIDMVRIAVDPKRFASAVDLAIEVKKMGFEVAFNVMYMSTWNSQTDFLNQLPKIKGVVDYFYMVDSFGGIYPEDVKEIYELVRNRIDIPLGFHGHNNLELALINTLTAIDCGIELVDSTITGMGRGAGNLRTALLLTVLNSKGKIELDFNVLSKIVDVFTILQKKYEWGTNLPYMVSGANSLPQKDVMNWVGKGYSSNSIIKALNYQSQGIIDNLQLPLFNPDMKINRALIIGEGPSVGKQANAIKQFLNQNPDIIIIHSSSKNTFEFNDIENQQIFCLAGNEGRRMEEVFKDKIPNNAWCLLPPFPRKMGTNIPNTLKDSAFELTKYTFTDKFIDTRTAIALQSVIDIEAKELFIVGYDGYKGNDGDEKKRDLLIEDQYLFNSFSNSFNGIITSVTPSIYDLKKVSVHSFI